MIRSTGVFIVAMIGCFLALGGCVRVQVFHPDMEGTLGLGPDRPFWTFDGPIRHVQTPLEPRAQETPSWCWAAAGQMVLASQGVDIAQSEIVRRAYGDVREAGGKAPLLVQALTGTFQAHQGPVTLKAFRADGFPANGLELVASIEEGRPFILDIGFSKDTRNAAGNLGAHSLVVTGITYQRRGNAIRILSLDTVDPSFAIIRQTDPHYQPRQRLDASELHTVQGTIGVYRLD